MFEEHYMKVSKLRAAIAFLRDDDVLIPNAVANLAVYRGQELVAAVDFLYEDLEFFNDDAGGEAKAKGWKGDPEVPEEKRI